MADGQVVFEIEGDTRGIKQALSETTNAIKTESKKWDKAGESSANGIEKSFTGMFAKISAAAMAAKVGQALINFGKDALQAASDLEEVQNVVDVTFGASSKQIDKWAQNAINQFGLTETQAKRYTSTIGAMMKSMGLSGDAVTQMSEDLAGLAADMASFYNLDFDTAFAKIRSGISGETEPLKQLGINMSQANLEAFMLQKGIEKTWKEMSASEQAMIRYQYLMQSTADAQGDFARTTDGVANGMRLFESEMETFKTRVGGPLKTAFGEVLGVVNKLIETLMPEEGYEKRHTILDDLEAIDEKTQSRIEKIQDTAEQARALLTVYTEIAENTSVPTSVGKIADAANKLDSSSPLNWSRILTAFKSANFTGLDSQTGVDVQSLADGLSGISTTDYKTKKDAWSALLGVLNDNVDVISSFTGQSPDEIKQYLGALATSANDLDENAGAAWDSLMSSLATYLAPVIGNENLQTLSGNLGSIKDASNDLDPNSPKDWRILLNAFKNANFTGIDDGTGANIQALADGLSGISTDNYSSKAEAWSALLWILGQNVDTIAALTGQSPDSVKNYLGALAESANGLEDDAGTRWGVLMVSLAKYLGPAVTSESLQTLAGNIGGIKDAGNGLDTSTPGNWQTFLGALTEINGLQNIFGEGDTAKQKIADLAQALSGNSITTTKAKAWGDMIDAILKSETITGMAEDKLGAVTKELTDIKEAASELDEGDVEAWNTLFERLLSVPGLDESDEGKRLIDILSGTYEGFASAAEAAETAQEGLGDATGDTATEQARLLNLSRQMVSLIPELSDAFDGESGAIKLTTDKIEGLINKWEEAQIAFAEERGAQEKVAAVEADVQAVEDAKTAADSARSTLIHALTVSGRTREEAVRYADRVIKMAEYGRTQYLANNGTGNAQFYDGSYWFGKVARGQAHFDSRLGKDSQRESGQAAQAWMPSDIENRTVLEMMIALQHQTESVTDATIDYFDALYEAIAKEEEHAEAVEVAADDLKEKSQASKAYAQELRIWTTEEVDSVKLLVEAYNEALTAASTYYSKVRSEIDSSVRSTIQGFGKLETAAQQARNNTKSGEVAEEGTSIVQGEGISAGTMRAGLQSQLDYMRNYQKMLAQAQAAGFSDEVIAALADGSTESYDYLEALIRQGITESDVQEINRLYAEVGSEREKFVDDLTAKQLAVDDTWKELNNTVTEAANTLTNTVTALGLTTSDMMTAMIDGIESKAPDLAKAVEQVRQMLSYLESHGFYASATGGISYGTTIVDGSHANGLDYVPFDGYIAQLHKGESILDAEEAELYRQGNPGLDYGAMIADMGGDVYLDGRIVGRVISDRQADNYRTLERSGWRG